MRVTNQMMAASMLGNLNQLRSRQATLAEQISSGDRITKASEDPMAGAEVMRIQTRGNALRQWQSNLGNTKSWVYATEAKLGDITDLINTAKELALQGSNGTLSTETMKGMAPAADQLMSDLLAALNEKEPNGALFGGFVTDKDPFTTAVVPDPADPTRMTLQVTYIGDAGNMQRDVGPGVTMTANMQGNRLASNLPAGWSDPNNMLTAVWEVAQGLANGDSSMVAGALSKLDTARQNVVALRSEMGARQMRVEQLEGRQKEMQVTLNDALQQAQGTDVTKALLELNNADTTYRAALTVGGRVLPQTLADFLR